MLNTRANLTGLALTGLAFLIPLPAGAQDDVPDQEMGALPPEDVIEANRQEPAAPPAEGSSDADAPSGQARGGSSSGSADDLFAQQTQVLSKGTLRVDAAPADFAMRDSGFLGGERGLRIGRADIGQDAHVYASLGLGLSYGVMKNLEVGILQLPILFDDGFGNRQFGGIELHGRFGILQGGPVEFGAQLTLELPTDNTMGVGVALPLRIKVADFLVIDTGMETEVFTVLARAYGPDGTRNTLVNLDVPVALNFYVTSQAFVGARFGMYVYNDFDDVVVPLGLQGGYGFRDGAIQLSGWFQWPAIVMGRYRLSDDPLDVGTFEFGVGANFFFDVGPS